MQSSALVAPAIPTDVPTEPPRWKRKLRAAWTKTWPWLWRILKVLFWVVAVCAVLFFAWLAYRAAIEFVPPLAAELWRFPRSFYYVFFADDVEVTRQFLKHCLPYWDATSDCFTPRERFVKAWITLGVLILTATYTLLLVRRSVVRRRKWAREEAERLARSEADRQRWAVEDAFRKGRERGKGEGIAHEQAIIRKALIHAFRPKMQLPPVPEGNRRFFWIHVTMEGPIARPVRNDHYIRWTDATGEGPASIIGAPRYSWVESSSGYDELAIMGVVYTLLPKAGKW